jgi:ABC-type uncharacterized transport system ATPase subunit
VIEGSNLDKHSFFSKKEARFAGSPRSFFSRQTKTVKAVDGISLNLGSRKISATHNPAIIADLF